MQLQVLAFWAAGFPGWILFLVLLLVADCVFLVVEERRRARRVLPRQVRECLEDELIAQTTELRRANDEASRLLAALAAWKPAPFTLGNAQNGSLPNGSSQNGNSVNGHALPLLAELPADVEPPQTAFPAFTEPLNDSEEQHDAELSGAPIAVAASIDAPPEPHRGALDWTSPESLLHQARQAEDWTETADYLARIDPGAATSRNLQAAGTICREHGFQAKALELYRDALAKDPENAGARIELLALSAQILPAERADSLRQLQELVEQSFDRGEQDTLVQRRFFTALTEIGRHTEIEEFCRAQLSRPLPPASQCVVHQVLAQLYRSLHKYDEALPHAEAALQLLPDDPGIMVFCGRLLLEAGRPDEAYRVVLRYLQLDPTSARSYILLAEIQEKRIGRVASHDLLKKALPWADAREMTEIEGQIRRLNALEDLVEIVPSTRPQIIQA